MRIELVIVGCGPMVDGVITRRMPRQDPPGSTISFALANGLRLAGNSHLLTTAPFGHLDRYAPSGPTLF
ncbi:MAG: hypothetical protein ACRDF9_01030 [Candidatus Limnocylindria bacterium]